MESFLCLTALYLGGNSLLLLGLGLAGWLSPWPIATAVVLTTAGWTAALVLARRGGGEGSGPAWGLIDRLLFAGCALVVLSAVLEVFSAQLVFDETLYHLSLPRHFLRLRAITALPYNLYANFPLNIEMLYLPLSLAFQHYGPRLLNLGLGVLSALAIYQIAEKHVQKGAGLAAAAVFLSMIAVGNLLAFAYNDLGLLFFCLVSLLGFLNWVGSDRAKWLVLSGLAGGFAAGSKYFGLAHLLIIFVGALIVLSIKRRPAVRPLACLLLPALAVFAPWMVKNYLFAGDPLYPFLFPLFKGRYWDAENARRYSSVLYNLYGPAGSGFWRYLRLPAFLVYETNNDVPVGPVLLLAAPFLFLLKKIDLKQKLLFGYLLFFAAIWAATSMVIRFLFPALAVFSILAGAALSRYQWPRYLVAAFLVFNSYLVIDSAIYMNLVSGEANDLRAIISDTNRLAAPGARVLLVGEVRTYGLERDFIAPSMFDQNYLEQLMERHPDDRALTAELKRAGVEWLLFSENRLPWLQKNFQYFKNEEDLQRLAVYLNSPHARQLERRGQFYLFRLK